MVASVTVSSLDAVTIHVVKSMLLSLANKSLDNHCHQHDSQEFGNCNQCHYCQVQILSSPLQSRNWELLSVTVNHQPHCCHQL